MNYKFHLSVLTGAVMIAVLVTLIAPMYTGAVGPSANPPDNSGLVPTFSGLNVNGETNIDVNNDGVSDLSIFVDETDVPQTLAGSFNAYIGTIYSGLTVGGDTNVDNLIVEGEATFESLLDVDSTATFGDEATFSDDIDLRGELKNDETLCHPYLGCFPQGLYANDNFNINGHLTVDSIGSISIVEATTYMPAGSVINTANAICPAGTIRLSCGGGFNGGLNAKLNNLYPDQFGGNSCFSSADNSAGGGATLYAYAICLDPDGV